MSVQKKKFGHHALAIPQICTKRRSRYDHAYGWGIVQAKAAVDYIAENGCKASNNVLSGGDGSAH